MQPQAFAKREGVSVTEIAQKSNHPPHGYSGRAQCVASQVMAKGQPEHLTSTITQNILAGFPGTYTRGEGGKN